MAEPTVHTDHKVTGTQTIEGNQTVAGTAAVTGVASGGRFTLLDTVDVSSVTPTVVGQLVKDASNILYISTGISVPGDWTKVGTQV